MIQILLHFSADLQNQKRTDVEDLPDVLTTFGWCFALFFFVFNVFFLC